MSVREPVLLVATLAVALLGCSSTSKSSGSDDRVPPEAAGSRSRECTSWDAAPLAAGATERRASWSSVFRDDHSHTTLGVVHLEWTYYSGDGLTEGGRTCVETLGVDPRVAMIPTLTGAPFAREAGGQFRVTLDVQFRGPARREGDKTLNAPEAMHSVVFAASGAKVEKTNNSSLDNSTLHPEWGDAKLVFDDGPVYVDPVALQAAH